jgi:hypothetical protein
MKRIVSILLWVSVIGCSLPTNPIVAPEWELEIIPRLDTHNNNYILPLSNNSLQTIHRISGRILKDGEEPYPPEKVSWEIELPPPKGRGFLFPSNIKNR